MLPCCLRLVTRGASNRSRALRTKFHKTTDFSLTASVDRTRPHILELSVSVQLLSTYDRPGTAGSKLRMSPAISANIHLEQTSVCFRFDGVCQRRLTAVPMPSESLLGSVEQLTSRLGTRTVNKLLLHGVPLLVTSNIPAVYVMSGYHGLGDLRFKYRDNADTFTEDKLVSTTDPYAQFSAWFKLVKEDPAIIEPNAMCIATCDKDGQPSARFVLLKGFGEDIGGFSFFTNYESRKGTELSSNPKVALTFYWAKLNRQVRVEGKVEKLDETENVAYFKKRPLKSQIGAAASQQSTVIASRDVLVEKAEQIAQSCNGTVEKPPSWGGYLVVPHFIEFWQGQDDRLHDRLCFKRESESAPWQLFRLSP